MNYEDFLKNYSDGDDIPMSVGIMGIPGEGGDTQNLRAIFASILVDYAFAKRTEVCDAYTEFFEKLWDENRFDGGFEISRVNQEQVYMASKAKQFVRAFEGDHTKDFTGPVLYANVNGEKDAIDKFFEVREKKGYWVAQFRTTKASYLYLIDAVTGNLVEKYKMNPLKLVEREGDNS